MSPARVSHERVFLDAIRAELEGIPNAEVFSGLKPENRYELKGWELSLIQRFQFDDLRVELPDCAVVIEAESAGGVGNLVKYWPCSETDLWTSALSWVCRLPSPT